MLQQSLVMTSQLFYKNEIIIYTSDSDDDEISVGSSRVPSAGSGLTSNVHQTISGELLINLRFIVILGV